jgi:hypothetical protein
MGQIGKETKIYEIPEPVRIPDTVPSEQPVREPERVPVPA